MTQPIAIVVPPKAGGGGKESNGKEDEILSALHDLAKKNNLSKMEMPSHVIVGQEEWTPESGYVTAAQKVQRAKVAEGFKEEIEVRSFFRCIFFSALAIGLLFLLKMTLIILACFRSVRRRRRGSNARLGWFLK
jgi:hypothetical protein